MPHDPDRYYRQLRAAREVGLRMTGASLDAFRRLLEEYAERLAVAVGRATDARAVAFDRATLDVVDRILGELTRDMATATRNAVSFTVREVSEIHARATASLLQAEGLLGLQVPTTAIGTRVLQSYLARPELAEAFVTIRTGSAAAVNSILQRAAVEGVSGPQLAMQLRTHVIGADAIPARYLLDRRTIGYEAVRAMGLEPTPQNLAHVRSFAGKVSNKAQLIARTEPMGAQHEAHAQLAAESPVVEAIQWRLSYRHPKEDACDALADMDLFGLGPGMYDPRQVPPRPHPRCLCNLIDIIRDVDDWGKSRGNLRALREDADSIGDRYGFPPSERRQLAAVLETATTRRSRRAA